MKQVAMALAILHCILVFAKQVNITLCVLWLDNKKYISTAIYFLAFMRDSTVRELVSDTRHFSVF